MYASRGASNQTGPDESGGGLFLTSYILIRSELWVVRGQPRVSEYNVVEDDPVESLKVLSLEATSDHPSPQPPSVIKPAGVIFPRPISCGRHSKVH